MTKKISTEAYQVLRDTLPLITWYKPQFERFLKTTFRQHPELLVELDFGQAKRVVADLLVDRLMTVEHKYQDATLAAMVDIAGMTTFPDIERLKEPDRSEKLDKARAAVANLRAITQKHSDLVADLDKSQQAIKATADTAAKLRRFSDDLNAIRERFLVLQSSSDPHQRGRDFERLLHDLFVLFDLEPHLAYSLALEQIDGSFSFETDDYIVEARWRNELSGREHGDVFKAKVESKGKNAVGIFISVSGFTSDFYERFKDSTPFITMDGPDLFSILDDRIRLDEVLRAKKRHANDTGSCKLSVTDILSGKR